MKRINRMLAILLFLLVIVLAALACIYNKQLFGGVDPDPPINVDDLKRFKISLNGGLDRYVNTFDKYANESNALALVNRINKDYVSIVNNLTKCGNILKIVYKLESDTYEMTDIDKLSDFIQQSILKLYKCLPDLQKVLDPATYDETEEKIIKIAEYVGLKTLNDIHVREKDEADANNSDEDDDSDEEAGSA